MVPSTKVPVAVSCVEAPAATEAFAGVTAIEICVGEATVRFAVPLIPFHFASMVDCPNPCAVTTDDLLPPGIVAVFPEVAVHEASVVTSWVEPSLKVAIAE